MNVEIKGRILSVELQEKFEKVKVLCPETKFGNLSVCIVDVMLMKDQAKIFQDLKDHDVIIPCDISIYVSKSGKPFLNVKQVQAIML